MIILLQGPPGSGKSTLGKALGRKLGSLYLSKDDVKEVLFDSLGMRDSEWSTKLGIASNSLLFLLIRESSSSSTNLIIETNFSRSEDIEKLNKLAARTNQKIIEIYLYAGKRELMNRVKSRWESGLRHEGHSDEHRYGKIEKYIEDKISQPARISHDVIEINTEGQTSDFVLDIVEQRLINIIGP